MKENNVRTKEIPDSEMPELMREAFRGTAVNKPTDVVYPYMDGTERNITINFNPTICIYTADAKKDTTNPSASDMGSLIKDIVGVASLIKLRR